MKVRPCFEILNFRFRQICSCKLKADTKVRLGGKQAKWEVVEGYSMNNMILLVFLEAPAFSYASRYIKLEKLIKVSAFEITHVLSRPVLYWDRSAQCGKCHGVWGWVSGELIRSYCTFIMACGALIPIDPYSALLKALGSTCNPHRCEVTHHTYM